MSIKVGCFALINPFSTLDAQLDQIKEWGFKYADLTDSSDGACLGNEYGFTAMASLDANPFDLKRMFEDRGLTMTSVCAHANLLDPAAPFRYGTSQIMKAIKVAAAIGVKHLVTSEGDPTTEFGHRLSTLLHCGNIALKLNRKVEWNPANERFVNDPEAEKFRKREMREKWSYSKTCPEYKY